jgi:hypothetical protein
MDRGRAIDALTVIAMEFKIGTFFVAPRAFPACELFLIETDFAQSLKRLTFIY